MENLVGCVNMINHAFKDKEWLMGSVEHKTFLDESRKKRENTSAHIHKMFFVHIYFYVLF